MHFHLISIFFLQICLVCGSVSAGENALFTSSVVFQRAGGKITVNGFPVADMPYGGDPERNAFSNDVVSGYLKSGQNRLVFFFQPADAVTDDDNAAYGSFSLQRGETKLFSLSLPPQPRDLAAELADKRATLLQGSLRDAALVFARNNEGSPDESWLLEMDFARAQERFMPQSLTFFNPPDGLKALDVHFGASGIGMAEAPLLLTENEYEKKIDLSALAFPENEQLSRMMLRAGNGEAYWEAGSGGQELSFDLLLLKPRVERQTVVIELALAGIPRRIWEEADTLDAKFTDADRQALLQLAESLNRALREKNVEELARLYTGKIRALSEMTLRSPAALAAGMRSFFMQTLFSQPTWRIDPMPPQDQILFEVYENRKVVELRRSEAGWLFKSDIEDGQFRIPFKCLKMNGAWSIYE